MRELMDLGDVPWDTNKAIAEYLSLITPPSYSPLSWSLEEKDEARRAIYAAANGKC